MKKLLCIATLLAMITPSHATMSSGAWIPLFKGVDHVVGTNYPDSTISQLQVVHCVRIDLADPGVQLFTTPQAPGYAAESRETLSASINSFIRNYGVQIA